MYDLPAHLQALIYSYDATYRERFALVLLQLHLVFTGWGRMRGYRRVLRELNRQCWLMYGDAASGHRYAVMWHRARRGGRLVRGSVSGS